MNKYICPKCGGKLYIWKGYAHEKRCNINFDGTIGKPYKVETGQLDQDGVGCNDCDFVIYGEDINVDNFRLIYDKFINKLD